MTGHRHSERSGGDYSQVLSPHGLVSVFSHRQESAGEDGGEEWSDPVQGGDGGVWLQQTLHSSSADR